MKLKNIKIYTYAITKRLQGYQLLKNPKGTSAYEVNMIKNSENIGYNLDRFSSYTRISKNFTTGQTVKKHLSISRYLFWTDKNKEIKKERFGYTIENGKQLSVSENTVSIDELNNRNFDYIEQKRKSGTVYDVDFSKIYIGKFDVKKVTGYNSIRELEILKFFKTQHEKSITPQPSFWNVLKTNLK